MDLLLLHGVDVAHVIEFVVPQPENFIQVLVFFAALPLSTLLTTVSQIGVFEGVLARHAFVPGSFGPLENLLAFLEYKFVLVLHVELRGVTFVVD